MALRTGILVRLSWRNLWRNYRRTLIMLLAITVGVWAIIFMTALLRGMVDDMVRQGLETLPGQVQIHAPQYRDDPSVTHSMSPPDASLLTVLDGPQVHGWSSRVKVPAMVSSEYANRGVTLLGVDPAAETAVGFSLADITAGRFLESADDTGIVIGEKLRQRLQTRVGKRLVVMSQNPENVIVDRGFTVVGVFHAELESREESVIYAGRSVVQGLLGLGGDISEIALLGSDYRAPETLVQRLRLMLGERAEVLPWQELDPYLATMMRVMDGFVLVWMIVVFMALSFGLVNTLMMAVFERVREIGLMQALGMRPSDILYQFLLEALMLLGLGLLAGNVLAYASIVPLQGGIDVSAVAKGLEMMGASSVLYPLLHWPDVLLADGVVIGLGILTSVLPAWRAARYQPVEAIARAS